MTIEGVEQGVKLGVKQCGCLGLLQQDWLGMELGTVQEKEWVSGIGWPKTVSLLVTETVL